MAKLNTSSLEPYLETMLLWLNNREGTIRSIEIQHAFKEIVYHVSELHSLHFTTDFSRLAFLIHLHNISSRNAWQYHHLRVSLKEISQQKETNFIPKALKVLINFIHELLNIPIKFSENELFQSEKKKVENRIESVKAIALEFKQGHLCLTLEPYSYEKFYLLEDKKNDHIQLAFRLLREKPILPCDVILEDVEFLDNNQLNCSFVIIQPNYLIDISSIASCVEYQSVDTDKYVLNKLLPSVSNQAILLGNVVNSLFDELIFDQSLDIQEFIKGLLHRFPLALSLLSNQDLKLFIDKLKIQYHNLLFQYLRTDEASTLSPENSYIEPSFISPFYGIQGRLDALVVENDSNTPNQIIELKSGKIFRPNKYGLNHHHYAQTLLYELLTKNALKKYGKNTSNYILYSSTNDHPLRFAPSTKNMFNDLKSLRNLLIANEYQNLSTDGWIKSFRSFYHPSKQNKKGFIRENYDWIKSMLSDLRDFEKDYLLEQLAFLTREQMQNKIGDSLGRYGQSAIWNQTLAEKRGNFSILDYLVIERIETANDNPSLVLNKSEKTNHLSSLRKGDIVILYPNYSHQEIDSSQIYKCSITKLDQNQVILKLRTKQKNVQSFAHRFWNVEGDYLDNAIHRNMSSLCQFLKANKEHRDLLLRPQQIVENSTSEAISPILPDHTIFGSEEQISILKSYFNSNRLFVLWGPPGSGKTSIVLHQMVGQIISNSDQHVLIVAYTNRAVDEICEAVLAISDFDGQLIRIGSEQSTAEEYQDYLLQNKVRSLHNREQLKKLIGSSRVVVGTLASLEGKKDIFQIKKFDRLIVDEASQILDAQLLWLSTKVDHLCLIGDHHQLPAVVTQNDKVEYQSDHLRKLGFNYLSESLFSRLIFQLQSVDAQDHIAMLTHQGRMHKDICNFVSEEFYGDKLHILPSGIPRHAMQKAELSWNSEIRHEDPFSNALNQQRFLFLDSKEPEEYIMSKSSFKEADLIYQILQKYEELLPGINWNKVGIITPFKAQIAAIRQRLSSNEVFNTVKIDTVERYQGGAKDIIIISLAVNSISSLRLISNLNDNSIDRKLNVAISRAREQIIVIGNEKIIETDETYKRLINYAYKMEISG